MELANVSLTQLDLKVKHNMDGISDLTKREFMGEVKHILSHTKNSTAHYIMTLILDRLKKWIHKKRWWLI